MGQFVCRCVHVGKTQVEDRLRVRTTILLTLARVNSIVDSLWTFALQARVPPTLFQFRAERCPFRLRHIACMYYD